MSTVVHFPRRTAPAHTDATRAAHARFCAARGDAAQAFADWLRTAPPAEDVVAELEATTSQLRQLQRLLEAGDGA